MATLTGYLKKLVLSVCKLIKGGIYMNSFYSMAKRAGMVFMVGLLFFIVQGCQKPFISVEVEVDGCCKEGDCTGLPGMGACPPPIAIPATLPAGTYDGIQCNTGYICASEDYDCARLKKCDTQHTSGSATNCTCACVSNPT